MTVKTYYLSKSKDAKLSTNFTVKEFASHDGADTVLIDDKLVNILQKVRDHFRKPVTVSSGFRTATYNASIGGSSKSYHVKGQAADIKVKGVNPVIVGMYVESLNAGGIGLYSYYDGGFVHVDTREIKYRWLCVVKNGTNQEISKILPNLQVGGRYNTTNGVSLLQRRLGVSQSGTFGTATQVAVKNFQKSSGLKVDGIVGVKTWTDLFS